MKLSKIKPIASYLSKRLFAIGISLALRAAYHAVIARRNVPFVAGPQPERSIARRHHHTWLHLSAPACAPLLTGLGVAATFAEGRLHLT
jgi:hypothetical protein